MNKLILAFLLLVIMMCSISFADTEYRVGGGDIIKISVYDNPDLETRARIGSDGMILYPLLGKVNVAGKTVTEIADHIASLLAKGYINYPQVTVFIDQYQSKKVVIIGQVMKPGLYELSRPTSLLELISKAEGLTKEAGNKVVIKRPVQDNGTTKESVITIHLQKLMEERKAELDVQLVDGDSVYIPKAYTFYVTGEVKKPNSYVYEEGITLIKAISMSGGFTDIASKGKIRIIRNVGGKEDILQHVNMNEVILPDDVIVVPESFF